MQIMTHEIGHSLGLLHSDVPTAVMSAVYHGYNPEFALDEDDIWGIQILYGKRTETAIITRIYCYYYQESLHYTHSQDVYIDTYEVNQIIH